MSEVKTYAVNCNDAWLNTDGDDISGSYVKYADYIALATKLDLAEHACAALAAENAALKQSEKEFNNFCRQEYYGWEDNFTETPATDAFLDEIRAQGVEMFAQWCRGERDFTLIDEDIADAAAYEECVKRAEYFAAQLRKGE